MTTTRRPGLRAFWVQIHLWLGLTLGVVGVLVALSGSILVYDHELDAQLNPYRYAISGPQIALPYADYAQRAQVALDGNAFLAWQRMLHEGSALGIVWRFLTILGGMLPALLMVTGLTMWLRKRRQRRTRTVGAPLPAAFGD